MRLENRQREKTRKRERKGEKWREREKGRERERNGEKVRKKDGGIKEERRRKGKMDDEKIGKEI